MVQTSLQGFTERLYIIGLVCRRDLVRYYHPPASSSLPKVPHGVEVGEGDSDGSEDFSGWSRPGNE